MRRLTQEDFLDRARAVHGNTYSYDKTIYKNNRTKVVVTCRIHGDFEVVATQHIDKGQGCKQCAIAERNKKNTESTDYFIAKAKKAHGDTYDYSRAVYVSSTTPIEIICRKHGSFWQQPAFHYAKHGCPKCGKLSAASKLALPAESFIAQAQAVHGAKYDYSQVKYVNSAMPVTVICKEHGPFHPRPHNHLYRATRCPACKDSEDSRLESEVFSFVKHLCETAKQNDKQLIRPKEVDILVEDKKIAIEVCGLYWHRTNDLRPASYHLEKLNKLEQLGYRLITLFEDEWQTRQQAAKATLTALLSNFPPTVVGARACQLEELDAKTADSFLTSHHLMGAAKAETTFGLTVNGIVFALASFSRPRVIFGSRSRDHIELVRYCTLPGYSIPGALQKLCRAGAAALNSNKIVSYVDRRWFTGKGYLKAGFSHVSTTPPNYWYVKGNRRYSRFAFAKHTLANKLAKFDPALTEKQNMLNHGYSMIHDCGNLKMLLTQ